MAVEAGSGTDEPVASAGGTDDVVTPETETPVEAEVSAEPVPDTDEPTPEPRSAEDDKPSPDAPAATEFFAPIEVEKPSAEALEPEVTEFFARAESDDKPPAEAPEPAVTEFFAPVEPEDQEPAPEPRSTENDAPSAEAPEPTEFFAPVEVEDGKPSGDGDPEATKFFASPVAASVPEEKPEEQPETFLTAEAMEFFAVPAAEAKVAESSEAVEPSVAAPVASTFGVPEIFRAAEPTEFLSAPEPAAETEPDAEPAVPPVVRDPDDADTVVFAGVLDLGELDEPPVVPAPAKVTAKQKNNPAVLTGVLTMVLCSVLGLGLISGIDSAKPVAGRAVAAPVAATPSSASTEPVRPRAVQRLEDHPLLVTPRSLPEITCDLPKFGTSDDQLAAYYAAGVKCLDAAWGPVLKDANLPFDPPSLDASPELSDGPCGAAPASEDAVAYYCGRNRMIYMPTGRLRENGGGDRPATHLATLAHEYGHHVQAMSGMLRAADVKIVNAGEKTPAGLEMSRRIELQANCFAGMFLGAAAGKGSISRELANRAEEDFQYAMEEAPDKNAHGSPVNQGNWALSGFDANTTDACNTYAAPAAEVG
ncbi:neutral zinc metallopeptidase [Umezawaea sp. NPDC059074]|uniref:neutral zinc metallopeptidase n=1 Tax=Umezawaea sp. NPDC059074 TaxID=3346716 RepID=UPI0036C5E0B2